MLIRAFSHKACLSIATEYKQSCHHHTHVNLAMTTQNHLTVNRLMTANILLEYCAPVYFTGV